VWYKHYLLVESETPTCKTNFRILSVAFQNILKIAGIPQFLAKMEQLKHYMDIKVQSTQTLQSFFFLKKYLSILANS
jgi:hypothetical protein